MKYAKDCLYLEGMSQETIKKPLPMPNPDTNPSSRTRFL